MLSVLDLADLKGGKGDKGEQGDPGIPGPGAVTADTATAAYVGTDGTETRTALKRSFSPNGGLYLPSPLAGLRWRLARTDTMSGKTQAHIAILGDSISYGAGTSSPKVTYSWPGVLRKMLDARFGPAGTGVVIANMNIRSDPASDPRWTYNGVTDAAFGFHQQSSFRLDAVAGVDIRFAATCDQFVVLNAAGSGGINVAQVDATAAKTFRNVTSGATPDFEREAGTHSNQILTKIPAGALGAHTLKLTPNTTSNTFDMFVLWIEGRISTLGTFRLSNPSIGGRSLTTLLAEPSSETTGFTGLPLIDVLNADLLVIALGINDWLTGVTVATAKTQLKTVVQRQRMTGTSAGGGTQAGGDVLLVWNPGPDLSALTPTSGTATWDQYREMFYQVADEENVPLLDLGSTWGGYTSASTNGLFSDSIHPSNTGSTDVASSAYHAIMEQL